MLRSAVTETGIVWIPMIPECLEQHRDFPITTVPFTPCVCRRENLIQNVITQYAIALKLRFLEPLIRRGFVWKLRLECVILQHVFWFVSCYGGLNVNKRTPGPIQIVDLPDRAVSLAEW